MVFFYKKLSFLWLLFGVGLLALFLGPDYIRTKINSLRFQQPEIDCLTFFELPETEIGQLATSSFKIGNRGELPLMLSNFRKTCSCDSLLAKINNEFIPFTDLEIKPNSTIEFQFIQRARGEIGREMVSPVIFNSNDPEKPEISIFFRFPLITGGILFSPSMIDFGAIKPGDVYEANVDIFDKSGKNRKILDVQCSDNQIVKAKFIPAGERVVKPDSLNLGSFLGQLNIRLSSFHPKEIQEFVKIYVSTREENPDKLQITGKIVQPVEFAPSEVILPRNSPNGPVYKATIICKNPFKEPFRLAATIPNPNFDLKINKNNSEVIAVEVTFNPPENHQKKDTDTLYNLNFSADFPNKKHEFKVPILVKPVKKQGT